jgi:RNA polymerase sigma factor (sigma-70 family)
VSETAPAEVSQVLLDLFEEYVNCSARRLYRRANWRLGRWYLAQEIVQEAYLRLWVVWPEKYDAITQHDSYSNRVVDNLCFDYYRRRRAETCVEEIPDRPDSGEYGGSDASHDKVRRAVAELPNQQRELIYLHYYQHLSMAEVATRMGIAEKTAWNYHTLAKKRLRKLFDEQSVIAAAADSNSGEKESM